jgi:hypothetical protein
MDSQHAKLYILQENEVGEVEIELDVVEVIEQVDLGNIPSGGVDNSFQNHLANPDQLRRA